LELYVCSKLWYVWCR